MTTRSTDIEVPESWIIAGEVPLGLLSFLCIVSANGVESLDPERSHQISMVLDQPIPNGRARVRTERQDRLTNVRFLGVDGGSLASCLIAAAPQDGPAVADMPILQPDDLLDYEGCVPGLSPMYRSRPLPIASYNRGTADAWLQPIDPRIARPWACLTALDAWASPPIMDHARDVLGGREARPEPRRTFLRRATVTVQPTAIHRHMGMWLLRHSQSNPTDDATTGEQGHLASSDGTIHVQYQAWRTPYVGRCPYA